MGTRTTNNAQVPALVIGPWAFGKDDNPEQENMFVKRIFAGGDRSFAYTTTDSNNNTSYDARIFEYDKFLSRLFLLVFEQIVNWI